MQRPPTMQLQQRHPATDLLELMQGGAPVQPFANSPRQRPTGQVRFAVNGLLNALQKLRTEFSPANLHAHSLEHEHPRCAAKNVGHAQPLGRGLEFLHFSGVSGLGEGAVGEVEAQGLRAFGMVDQSLRSRVTRSRQEGRWALRRQRGRAW